MRKRTFLSVVMLVSIAFAISLPLLIANFFVAAGNAYAYTGHSRDHPLATITLGMQLDCASVPNTAQAQAILQQYHLCQYSGSQTTSTADGVIPSIAKGRVCGSCGCLILNLYNSKGGYLQWNGEITSTLGAMISASYSGSWLNLNTNGSLPVNRSKAPMFTTDWLDIVAQYTKAGTIYGRIDTANDLLFWGATCTNADSVYNYVTVS